MSSNDGQSCYSRSSQLNKKGKHQRNILNLFIHANLVIQMIMVQSNVEEFPNVACRTIRTSSKLHSGNLIVFTGFAGKFKYHSSPNCGYLVII